jgi:glycosyltransferase involved in cell wall biosynthesis
VSGRPLVSVVIPAYQSEGRIGRTLARLREQTLTDFEVIVVNDGSVDDTSEVVRRAGEADSRIRLVEQSNRGIAAARNRGVESARSDVLAFLDDDDLWHPQKLELQLARLDRMPEAALVSCYSALVDPGGYLLGWRLGGLPEGSVYREMLEWDMISGGSVAVVTRRAFEATGGFDVALPDRADWDLWIRLARRYPFTCVPRTLVGYTRRAGSVSQSYDRMLEYGRAVLTKARRDDPGIDDGDHNAFLARDVFGAACLCLADERHDMAWRYLTSAVRSAPRMILGRPRRWGVIAMAGLAMTMPAWLYRQAALAAMSRAAFRLRPGAAFDSIA